MSSVVERRVYLGPRPDSARRARRVVAAALSEVGRVDLAETAELLVSEVVTNAVVHARTGIDVAVTASPAGLRVTVRDGSRHLPTRRNYGRSATTGRGLELVGLLANAHGTETDDTGKTVWFEIGAGPEAEADVVPAPRVEAGHRTTGATTVVVRLTGVPVALALAWREQTDALLREYLLSKWEHADGDSRADGPAQDAFALLADALGPLARITGATARADVDLTLTPADAAGFDDLDDLLDQVILLAEHRQTLAPATQPEVRLFRRWISSQVRGQATGDQPAPWPGLPTQVAASPAPAPDWDVDLVRRSAAAVVAADDLNRVLAASPAALALLGWDEDLVGRRIVEIVPGRLREAHIAGFTRHLLTGESTILDRPVVLPALRRDGTEVDVRLIVRRTLATDGRPVFTATLEPVAAPTPPTGQRV